jgi:hypothetical protein
MSNTDNMQDFLLDENGDLLIINNEFVISDATSQYFIDTMQTEKGEYKANPQFGVGALSFLNGPFNIQNIKQICLTQLKMALVPAKDVRVTQDLTGAITIDPIY